MKPYLIAYAAAILAFLTIDGIWLGLVAKSFYRKNLGDLLRKNIRPAPAGAFYLFYTAGLVFVAVRPNQPDIGLGNVALYGAIIGFLAYGTYDMTNLSTLRNWPVVVSFVDMLWGTALSATVALLSALAIRGFS